MTYEEKNKRKDELIKRYAKITKAAGVAANQFVKAVEGINKAFDKLEPHLVNYWYDMWKPYQKDFLLNDEDFKELSDLIYFHFSIIGSLDNFHQLVIESPADGKQLIELLRIIKSKYGKIYESEKTFVQRVKSSFDKGVKPELIAFHYGEFVIKDHSAHHKIFRGFLASDFANLNAEKFKEAGLTINDLIKPFDIIIPSEIEDYDDDLPY